MIEDLDDIRFELKKISEFVNAAHRISRNGSPASLLTSRASAMLGSLWIDIHKMQYESDDKENSTDE